MAVRNKYIDRIIMKFINFMRAKSKGKMFVYLQSFNTNKKLKKQLKFSAIIKIN